MEALTILRQPYLCSPSCIHFSTGDPDCPKPVLAPLHHSVSRAVFLGLENDFVQLVQGFPIAKASTRSGRCVGTQEEVTTAPSGGDQSSRAGSMEKAQTAHVCTCQGLNSACGLGPGLQTWPMFSPSPRTCMVSK